MRLVTTTLFFAALWTGGCASRETRPAAGARSDTTRTGPETTAAVARDTTRSATTPIVTTPRAPEGQNAENMVGTWDLAPPAGGRGPQLTLAIDSARGSTFYGRLSRVLSGDMELSDRFRAFRGTIDTAGVADVIIQPRERSVPGGRLTGRVSGGRWTLSRFTWSGEEQVGKGQDWELRRVSR